MLVPEGPETLARRFNAGSGVWTFCMAASRPVGTEGMVARHEVPVKRVPRDPSVGYGVIGTARHDPRRRQCTHLTVI